MTVNTQAVFQQALRLDAVERAELIEALYRSFEKPGDPRVEARWSAEAESRIDAYESGKLTADSADNVFRRISHPR